MPRQRAQKSGTSSREHPQRRRTRRPPASHLLIIECEPEKLARQRLSFGSQAAALFLAMFPRKKIVLVRGSSIGELARELANTVQTNDRFRTILIVGHSNETGLQLTPDEFFEWSAIAGWVNPFQPELLLLAACRAGRSPAVQSLFDGVSTLKEIYASPVTVFSDQTHPFAGLLLAILKHRKIDESVLRILQATGYLFNDGLIYRWKRAELRNRNDVTGIGWDFLSDILNKRD